LDVKRSDTVHDVKPKIESVKGIPIDNQDVTIWEREMFDDDQLSLYNIKSRSIILLQLRITPPQTPTRVACVFARAPGSSSSQDHPPTSPELRDLVVARQDAQPPPPPPPPTTTPAEDADINTQLNYIKKLLQKGRIFLVVPLDEDDDDDDKRRRRSSRRRSSGY
jgi:hypothetical protein